MTSERGPDLGSRGPGVGRGCAGLEGEAGRPGGSHWSISWVVSGHLARVSTGALAACGKGGQCVCVHQQTPVLSVSVYMCVSLRVCMCMCLVCLCDHRVGLAPRLCARSQDP